MERGVEGVRGDASRVRRVSTLVGERGVHFRGDGASLRVARRGKDPRRDRVDVLDRERIAASLVFVRDGDDSPARRAVSDGGGAVGEHFARDVGGGFDGPGEDDVDDGDVRHVRSRSERRASRGDERAQTRGARKQRAPANAVIAEDGRAG